MSFTRGYSQSRNHLHELDTPEQLWDQIKGSLSEREAFSIPAIGKKSGIGIAKVRTALFWAKDRNLVEENFKGKGWSSVSQWKLTTPQEINTE